MHVKPIKPLILWSCDGTSIAAGDSWLTLSHKATGTLACRLRGKRELTNFAFALEKCLLMCKVNNKKKVAVTTARGEFQVVTDQGNLGVICELGRVLFLSRDIASDVLLWLAPLTRVQAPSKLDWSVCRSCEQIRLKLAEDAKKPLPLTREQALELQLLLLHAVGSPAEAGSGTPLAAVRLASGELTIALYRHHQHNVCFLKNDKVVQSHLLSRAAMGRLALAINHQLLPEKEQACSN